LDYRSDLGQKYESRVDALIIIAIGIGNWKHDEVMKNKEHIAKKTGLFSSGTPRYFGTFIIK